MRTECVPARLRAPPAFRLAAAYIPIATVAAVVPPKGLTDRGGPLAQDGVITKSELSAALTSSRGNSPGRCAPATPAAAVSRHRRYAIRSDTELFGAYSRDFRARSPAEPPRGSARLGTPPRPASLRSRSPPASTARPGPGR